MKGSVVHFEVTSSAIMRDTLWKEADDVVWTDDSGIIHRSVYIYNHERELHIFEIQELIQYRIYRTNESHVYIQKNYKCSGQRSIVTES